MTAPLGTLAVWGGLIAALTALGAAGLAIAGWRPGARVGAGLLTLAAALLGAGVLLLGAAMVGLDWRLAYVVEHAEASLPVHRRVTALWSGQEGSLLLWAALTAAGAAVAARGVCRTPWSRGGGATLTVLSGVVSGLAVAVVLGAPPFRGASEPVTDGLGLHPQLHHWAMAIHPPLVLLGYALLLPPFALACGALVDGGPGRVWAGRAERWTRAAWTSLGAGMLVGAWWAYVELGWGGYWAWDPVENASLMPWLAATALLHTAGLARRRGRLLRWTAATALLGYVLCLVGAYLTRSGAAPSVHAFTGSGVERELLTTLAATAVTAVGLFVLRARRLVEVSEDAIGPEAARALATERLIRIASGVLMVLIGGTLFGTLLPVLSSRVLGTAAGLDARYYNRMAAPLGFLIVALMAAASLLPELVAGAGRRRPIAPTVSAAAGALATVALGVVHPMVLACVALATFTLGAVGAELVIGVRTHARQTGFSLLQSAAMVLEGRRRATASRLAHAGVAVLMIGVAGSSLLGRSGSATLAVGETATVAGYELRLEDLREIRGAAHSGIEAELKLASNGGAWRSLSPQRRYYDKFADPVSEVAVASTPSHDVYVVMLGWNGRDRRIGVQVHHTPLVLWVWLGGGLIVAGGVVGLLPRRRAAAGSIAGEWNSTLPMTEPAAAPSREQARKT